MRLTIDEVENAKLCLLDDGLALYLYIVDKDYVFNIKLFEEDYTEEQISDTKEGRAIKNLV